MLARARIWNFRCLKDVTIDFAPLTVLVGPNSAGKSAVLDALGPGPFESEDSWHHRSNSIIRLEPFDVDTPAGAGRAFGHPRPYRYQLLKLQPNSLRKSNLAGDATVLEQDGSNLTNVIDTLPRREQESLAKRFCELVPAFADVDVRPHGSGQQRILFQDRWKPELWHAPKSVSDGSMLVLAYLAVASVTRPPELLAIEEPERGLHPYLIEQIMKLLRRLTAGELGRDPVQVVVATHSAELLDYVKPEEVRREIEGFILNRLQGALLAEAFRLVGEGYVSPQDLDKTIKDGLGLRWSFMGPFATIELNAPGGIADYCARYTGFYKRLQARPAGVEVFEDGNIANILREWGKPATAEQLAVLTRWRDQRLAALAAHKKTQSTN